MVINLICMMYNYLQVYTVQRVYMFENKKKK